MRLNIKILASIGSYCQCFGRNTILLILFLPTVSQAQNILVPPYLQPGNASSLAKEEKVLIWQTDSLPGLFKVEYTIGKFPGSAKPLLAKISNVKLSLNGKNTILYRAILPKLQFDQFYSYRVSINEKTIAENSFGTRTKTANTRFVVFGDCGRGTPQQAEVAYQVYQQKPQFILVTGDNVYARGLENEYRKNFFPYYTADVASKEKGSPLMGSTPFYMIVGNHDIAGADLNKYPDGLAYFYYNDLPLNAPIPESTVEAVGAPAKVKEFKANVGKRFPTMANYSFDYGNVHIACLDADVYINPLDPMINAWLVADMKKSKADWKIVAYHQPGFNSSKVHYDEQRMRLLAPQLEALGVDLVLTGHVHNYQRSLPLKFAPQKYEGGTQYQILKDGRVDGTFTLDNQFDGVTNTKPSGIIYIVTGAGGAGLYDKELTRDPNPWTHEPAAKWVPFTAKIISDVHSFSIIETQGKKLVLKQIDTKGNLLDEITITK